MRSIPFAFLALAAITSPTAAQETAFDSRAALYELRVYHAEPGKLDALNARFRDHTLKLFEKHGMRNVAYWVEQPTAESPDGKVIYVLAFPSREARGASWASFVADPEWQKVAASSEAGGKLIARIDSTLMSLADYSPPIAGAEASQ
jgi:hypothetical protein